MYLNILKLIQKIQKQARCPICNRKFSFSEIKVKYILDDLAVFHLNCAKGHQPIQTVHIAVVDKNVNAENKKQNNYISIKDKKIIDKQIKEFDGDFIKLWKK
jgi:hypothetical protein